MAFEITVSVILLAAVFVLTMAANNGLPNLLEAAAIRLLAAANGMRTRREEIAAKQTQRLDDVLAGRS